MFIYYLLKQRWVMTALLIINLIGTIWGYYWYRFQMAVTPTKFLIFVPDSPTASLFFCIVLLGFLFKRNLPLFEALAAVTLFKYGVWAVGMNIASGLLGYPWSGLLVLSHGSMAIEGLLYARFYRIKPRHLIIASLWTIHNDFIDYVFKVEPQYYINLSYFGIIAYTTFWLSIISIALVYKLAVEKKANNLRLSL